MSQNKETENSIIPQFHSLALCLLVDASHKSKNETFKNIVATDIFQEIVLAKSMSDGLDCLSGRAFDACIIGPSIRPDVARSYIEEARAASSSEDCAIIVLIKEDQELDEFLKADSVFTIPASKLVHFESIIRGVIVANKGSVWPGVRLNDDGKIEIQENGTWKILNPSGPGFYQGLTLDFVLDSSPESIEKFCTGLQKTPRFKLEKILMSILSKNSEQDPFLGYFKTAVNDWKDELEFSTLKEASLNLRRKLLDYKSN